MNARVGIVILNWNGWRDTIECLESVFNLAYREFCVFLVDNASSDQSLNHLRGWLTERSAALRISVRVDGIDAAGTSFSQRGLEFIASPINGGFAAGNNLGIRAALAAGCDFVWLLNNDTVVEATTLSAMIARISGTLDIGMCGSVLRYYDQRETIQAFGGVRFIFWRALGKQLGQGLAANSEVLGNVRDEDITYVAGASLLLSRAFLEDVGLMEEGYFLYFEEIDWAERARGRWKTALARESVVFHKEGRSIGTASRARRSPLSQYYLSRNLMLFYARYRPWLLPIALARLMREIALHLKNGDRELARVTLRAFYHGCIGRRGASY